MKIFVGLKSWNIRKKLRSSFRSLKKKITFRSKIHFFFLFFLAPLDTINARNLDKKGAFS